MNTSRQRHFAFLGLTVVLILVMLSGRTPSVDVSPTTRHVSALIDSLPPGSLVLLSFDHDASALPEIRPLAHAIVRQAMSHGLKIVGLSLLSEGTLFGYQLLREEAKRQGKAYGTDWTYLGFKPQPIAAILSLTESLRQTFPQDYAGHETDSLPMLAGITKLGDIPLVISVADGNTPSHWIEYGEAKSGVRVVAAVTAAMATSFDPYVQSGQLSGLLVGLRGGAEYETLLGEHGAGMRGMLAQTAAHLYILFMIVGGNLLYWLGRRRAQTGKGGQ